MQKNRQSFCLAHAIALLAGLLVPHCASAARAAGRSGGLHVTGEIIARQGVLLGPAAGGRILTLFSPPQNSSLPGHLYPREFGTPEYCIDLWQVRGGKLLCRWFTIGKPLADGTWFYPEVSIGDHVIGYIFRKNKRNWRDVSMISQSLCMLQISKSGPKIIWQDAIAAKPKPITLIGHRFVVVRTAGGLATLFDVHTGRLVKSFHPRLHSRLTVAPGYIGAIRGSSISQKLPAIQVWAIRNGLPAKSAKEKPIVPLTPRLCIAGTVTSSGGAILVGSQGHVELVSRAGIVRIRRWTLRRLARLSGSLLPWSPEILQISPNGRLCLCCIYAFGSGAIPKGYTQLLILNATNLDVLWSSPIRPSGQLAVGAWQNNDTFVTSGVSTGTPGTHVVEWSVGR